MRKEDKSKLIEVYKSSPWEAELVKGLLNASNIQAMLTDSVIPNVILPLSMRKTTKWQWKSSENAKKIQMENNPLHTWKLHRYATTDKNCRKSRQ